MKRRLKELTILVAVLGVIGVVVLVSGVVPVKASSGHWKITSMVLEFASSRSIATHSTGIEVPALDEPEMVRLGAVTYESNCRWCHGAPGMPQPVVPAGMTPPPPSLLPAAASWETSELFYIVKHGIKFAGMPAWPTQQRDEEIWPVIAFLEVYSELDQQQYRELILPLSEDDLSGEQLAERRCAACHGSIGGGVAGPRVPLLAGQHEDYLRDTLRAYRDRQRYSGVMQPIATRLTETQIAKLAAYYAQQPRLIHPPASDVTAESIQLGRTLASRGDQAKKIAACVECHGPEQSEEAMQSDEYPWLAGQPAMYLRQQLHLIQTRSRGGTDRIKLMHPIADNLSEAQIRALADYYQQADLPSP